MTHRDSAHNTTGQRHHPQAAAMHRAYFHPSTVRENLASDRLVRTACPTFNHSFRVGAKCTTEPNHLDGNSAHPATWAGTTFRPRLINRCRKSGGDDELTAGGGTDQTTVIFWTSPQQTSGWDSTIEFQQPRFCCRPAAARPPPTPSAAGWLVIMLLARAVRTKPRLHGPNNQNQRPLHFFT